MSEFNAFEVLGPIMVGPSSSHTAGACRISNVAAKIVEKPFEKVSFYLHGSFAMTYKGHGTDRALIGGILGFSTYDKRIRNAFEIADDEGLNYEFIPTDLGEGFHPNTVKIVFSYKDKEDEYIIGSSIGGGNILIVNIDGIPVKFKGEYPTFLFQYAEQKGIIATVSTILADNDYNIESMSTTKNELTQVVTLTVETSRNVDKDIVKKLIENERFLMARYVEV